MRLCLCVSITNTWLVDLLLLWRGLLGCRLLGGLLGGLLGRGLLGSLLGRLLGGLLGRLLGLGLLGLRLLGLGLLLLLGQLVGGLDLDELLGLDSLLEGLADEGGDLDNVDLVVGGNVLFDGGQGGAVPLLQGLDGGGHHGAGGGVSGGLGGLLGHGLLG